MTIAKTPEELRAQVEKYVKELPKLLQSVLTKWAALTTNAIKDQTPVKTGTLKASTNFELKETDLTIYNSVPYAAAVEFGHTHQERTYGKPLRFTGADGAFVFTRKTKAFSVKPNPFFFTTIEIKLPELKALFDKELTQFTNQIFG